MIRGVGLSSDGECVGLCCGFLCIQLVWHCTLSVFGHWMPLFVECVSKHEMILSGRPFAAHPMPLWSFPRVIFAGSYLQELQEFRPF